MITVAAAAITTIIIVQNTLKVFNIKGKFPSEQLRYG